MKFKIEFFLLLSSIAMFTSSAPAFCYSNEPVRQTLAFSLNFDYPYRGYAIALVIFGLIMMISAALLYKKRAGRGS